MTRISLSEKMTTGRKMGLLLDYLQNGGEVEVDGRTWVWLDNHITRTSTDENGEEQYWGINGLAIKGTSYNTITKEEKPTYIGQNDISFEALSEIVENVSEADWLGICAGNALKSLNKKR